VPRRDGQVELGLDVVQLKLHAPEFGTDVAGDLPAQVADAERAERELDGARAELDRIRLEAGTAEAPRNPKRRRSGQSPE
jgi:hypothetical protein